MRTIIFFIGVALLCASCRKPAQKQDVMFQTGILATNAYSLFAGATAPTNVPSEISDLQADGTVWMDMHLLCRFRAPPNIITSILANGYQTTNWDAVEVAMHPRNYTNSFSPKWDPDTIVGKECYLKRVENKHGDDTLYLVLDRHSGVVYAVGEGSVYK
ncbi:MAG: hypothetical protein JWM68_4862 [Verrucomicrobiales bacterium]|nr:hypothetical protein [Verrucomicrobiales bacterium]